MRSKIYCNYIYFPFLFKQNKNVNIFFFNLFAFLPIFHTPIKCCNLSAMGLNIESIVRKKNKGISIIIKNEGIMC